MALNSMIRKVPLLGNCDLTNFHADIHDYEGFEKDNSFFLNKRKVNWWKRLSDNGEVAGLHGVVNGDYFDIFKGSTFLGKISRQYYNLESVSATTYREDTVSDVINPYPNLKDWILFPDGSCVPIEDSFYDIILFENQQGATQQVKCYLNRKTSDYYLVYRWGYRHCNINQQLQQSGLSVDFSRDKISLSFCVFPEDITYNPTSHTIFSRDIPYLFFSIGDSDNPAYYRGQVTKDGVYSYSYNKCGYLYFDSNTPHVNVDDLVYSTDFRPGSTYTMHVRIAAFPLGKNRILLSRFFGYDFDDSSRNDGTVSWPLIYDTNGETDMGQTGDMYSGNAWLENYCSLDVTNSESLVTTSYNDGEPYNITFAFYAGSQRDYQINPTYSLDYGEFVHNYSKKYGKWAVNYLENRAYNIAHDYKKLFYIQPNEDTTTGKVLAIDGYNDTYIYFHSGSDYYRISIETADYLQQVAKSLNGIYVIFNTVSYHNALYMAANKFFCSCDDWNDRAQWVVSLAAVNKTYESAATRLNDKWQTQNEIVSTSDQIASYKRLFAYDSDNNILPAQMSVTFIDSNYTAPQYYDENLVLQTQQYSAYFPTTRRVSSEQVAIRQGFINYAGFTVNQDTGDEWTDPPSDFDYQNTPALLDADYLIFDTSVIMKNSEGAFQLMQNADIGIWELVYLASSVTILQTGDSIFVVNGVQYTYKAETNRIEDYSGNWCANTYLFRYLGFTSTQAFFYSLFDKCIYAFQGDNTFKKVVSLERYDVNFLVYEGVFRANTLYVSSLDLLFVNLTTAVLAIYDNQCIILDTGIINDWELDLNTGVLKVNEYSYSLIKSALQESNLYGHEITLVPIEIETQLFGNPADETNNVNDCVYLTVDNLQNIASGEVTLQAVGLQNQKFVKAEEKNIRLRSEDFNELSQCLIKYQPGLQECKGFKLKLKSDFEIAELKIGTSQGAMNQTTKRI